MSGLGLLAHLTSRAGESGHGTSRPETRAYLDRVAFNVWPNDVRLAPRPLENWPSAVFDDLTVDSIIRTMDVQAEAGYNVLDIAGFFATYSLPVDVRSAVDNERRTRIGKIVTAAHDRGMKVNLFPAGVYSWGFDEIIRQNPVLQGSNPHAMCASQEESFAWQKKMVDFALEFGIDGFHLESADQGRCSCEQCKKTWKTILNLNY